jgi:hypothetical protein
MRTLANLLSSITLFIVTISCVTNPANASSAGNSMTTTLSASTSFGITTIMLKIAVTPQAIFFGNFSYSSTNNTFSLVGMGPSGGSGCKTIRQPVLIQGGDPVLNECVTVRKNGNTVSWTYNQTMHFNGQPVKLRVNGVTQFDSTSCTTAISSFIRTYWDTPSNWYTANPDQMTCTVDPK